MINRGAILLRYKAPALQWINEAGPNDADLSLSLDEINSERTVYLIHDADAEDSDATRAWVERSFQALFENELESWYVDEDLWPDKLTLEMFNAWFDVECHSVVIDTVDEPIILENIEAEPS